MVSQAENERKTTLKNRYWGYTSMKEVI
jgi:hypothetical protein